MGLIFQPIQFAFPTGVMPRFPSQLSLAKGLLYFITRICLGQRHRQ